MGVVEWGAIVATCMLLIAVGGIVWNLATKSSKTDAKADAAATRADVAAIANAAISLKVDHLASELAKHREDVAEKYVSYTHMVNLENRLVEAITQLGNRIDQLFTRAVPHV